MFKTGYILTPEGTTWSGSWGFPFLAVALALGLPGVAAVRRGGVDQPLDHDPAPLCGVGALVRHARRLGPFQGPADHRSGRRSSGFTVLGLQFAPISLLLLVTAWDHQHSIMQQHGLARIYDFKAGAGLKHTRRYDLALHCVLYAYMFLNAPMFRFLWIRELHRMRVPLSVAFVERPARW